MAAVILAIGMWRVWRDRPPAPWTRGRLLVLAAVPFACSVAAWLGFHYVIWGSPWPSAPYGGAAGTQMSLRSLVRGVPGLLIDQEYGILAYAPALAIGAALQERTVTSDSDLDVAESDRAGDPRVDVRGSGLDLCLEALLAPVEVIEVGQQLLMGHRLDGDIYPDHKLFQRVHIVLNGMGRVVPSLQEPAVIQDGGGNGHRVLPFR